MNKFLVSLIITATMSAGVCFASDEFVFDDFVSDDMEVYVDSTFISGITWQLDYIVKNKTLDALEELTVEFDYYKFDNLTNASEAGAGCDIQVWPEISQTHDGWAFDVLFDSPVDAGQSFTGISMLVDYTGDGEPEMQYYELIDPATYAKIGEGYTVPEPVTVLLFGLGGVLIRKRQRGGIGQNQ